MGHLAYIVHPVSALAFALTDGQLRGTLDHYSSLALLGASRLFIPFL